MNKILQRSITGSAYVALLVAATVCSPVLFAAVFCTILLLGIIELFRLCNNGNLRKSTLAIDAAGGTIMFLSAFLSFYKPEWNINPLICYLPYLILRLIAQLYIKGENAISHLSHSFLTQAMVALPLTLLNSIYFEYGSGHILLACLIFIWMNDTGAFCVGSLIGKRRLFERISPKKSWEGFFGGLFFTVLTGIIISSYFPVYFDGLSLLQWIGFAIAVTVFATWGDLIESVVKRTAGVKDSSRILPGHGGILDRIDSLLLVSPATLIYLYLIQL